MIAAAYYCTRFGFQPIAYRGLETGHRNTVSHVIREGNITLVFQSPLNPNSRYMSQHMALHGDGVKDVAFTVDDTRAVYNFAVDNGAKSIRAPWEETDDDGTVVMATIATVIPLIGQSIDGSIVRRY